MQKDIILLSIGFLIFITPFLGVPESWRAITLFILGAGVVLLALTFRFDARRNMRDSRELFHEEHEPSPDTTTLGDRNTEE